MAALSDKHAVVLSGGGAHGAYEIGVLEALLGERSPLGEPIAPSIFTGTSVGSYNAAVMAAKAGPEPAGKAERSAASRRAVAELRRLWLERCAEIPGQKPNGVFRVRADPRPPAEVTGLAAKMAASLALAAREAPAAAWEGLKRSLNLVLTQGSWGRRVLDLFDLSYVLSTAPLERLIRDTVNLELLVRPDATAVRFAATDWDLGQAVVFSNKGPSEQEMRNKRAQKKGAYRVQKLTVEDGVSAILASTAIPGIFPARTVKKPADDSTPGKRMVCVDGVVLMNTPLRPAIELEATVLHVIYLDPELELVPEGHLPSTVDTLGRMMVVALGHAINVDIEEVEKRNQRIAMARELQASGSAHGERGRAFVDQYRDQRAITVHRYFPSENIGGVLGMLDFGQERLKGLIDLGFRDAVRHDCERCGCLIPGGE